MTPTQAKIAAQVRSYVRAEMGFGSDADGALWLLAGALALLRRMRR